MDQMAQQYSLRWNNHQPNFVSIITSLLNTQTLVDVTLSAEGKQLLAHKVVLSACSTYFQSLFVDNPSPHPIVILKDVTFADLRIIVDFMYCGQVNVTEEELPQVLETAKLLKIKGLTEMPDSTLLARSQATPTEYPNQQEPELRQAPESRQSAESRQAPESRQAQSPASSPTNKRRRRRRSSTSSTSLNIFDRPETAGPSVDAITLSSVPQQQRRTREYHEIRTVESQNSQQTPDQDNLASNTMAVDEAATASVLSVVPDNSATPSSPNSEIRHRRTSLLKRQPRILEDAREVRKQTSDPLPSSALVHKPTPTLQKYESYPQFAPKCIFTRKPPFRTEQEVALLIRTVTSNERQSSTTTTITSSTASLDTTTASESSQTPRASHTPAVRSGPPLSCNFCWNTVDECGRILRRKTQYHCPECRTNLCIVPCFHEYHEGPETELNTNAR